MREKPRVTAALESENQFKINGNEAVYYYGWRECRT